ncbi:MAG: hypothetical protein ACI8RD_005147 [Bacillariaceae sp.]|jgi:hypothetical protein
MPYDGSSCGFRIGADSESVRIGCRMMDPFYFIFLSYLSNRL